MNDTEISICIARVFKNVSKRTIHSILNILQFGDIERIDLVSSKNPKFNIAFIHYHRWNLQQIEIRNAILTGKKVKIIYKDPRFWLLSLSHSPKPEFQSLILPKIKIYHKRGEKFQQTIERYMTAPRKSYKSPDLKVSSKFELSGDEFSYRLTRGC